MYTYIAVKNTGHPVEVNADDYWGRLEKVFWYFTAWGAVGLFKVHPETWTACEKGNTLLTSPFLCHWVLWFLTLNCWLIVLPLTVQQQLCRVGEWTVGQRPCWSTTEAVLLSEMTSSHLGQGNTAASRVFLLAKAHPRLMWRASAVSIPALGPPTPGALLLLVGKSKDLWCLFYSGNLCTVVPRTHLVCLTSGPEWLHVFQMCLKVNLHSCTFSSSCSYFLGSSTCCQFTRLPLLVELMPLCQSLSGAWGKAELKWLLPCKACRCHWGLPAPQSPPHAGPDADQGQSLAWAACSCILTPSFIEVEARFF